MNSESEPVYCGMAHCGDQEIEVYHTHPVHWYAKLEGMSEEDFLATRAENPAQAIGNAILKWLPQNRTWAVSISEHLIP